MTCLYRNIILSNKLHYLLLRPLHVTAHSTMFAPIPVCIESVSTQLISMYCS